MKKPVITHTEILNRAISSIECEIEDWRRKCEGLPADQKEKMFTVATEELRAKLGACKALYHIETGAER